MTAVCGENERREPLFVRLVYQRPGGDESLDELQAPEPRPPVEWRPLAGVALAQVRAVLDQLASHFRTTQLDRPTQWRSSVRATCINQGAMRQESDRAVRKPCDHRRNKRRRFVAASQIGIRTVQEQRVHDPRFIREGRQEKRRQACLRSVVGARTSYEKSVDLVILAVPDSAHQISDVRALPHFGREQVDRPPTISSHRARRRPLDQEGTLISS